MEDRTAKNLTTIINSEKDKKIIALAKDYLYFYSQGDLGSNSPGLVHFLQDPQGYVNQWGCEVLGVM